MKISINWLKSWVNTKLSNQEIADYLTMAGLEVDGLFPIAGEFDGVVVGEILSCAQHENADKLQVCTVNIGTEQTQQIICGAPNARAGIKVAVATIGAQLPGFKIKKAKLRGIESHGMLCSAGELGLNEDLFTGDGILELASNLTIGQDIISALNLDDEIIELDITPNRGDCFSVEGVARELAIGEGLSITTPKIVVNTTLTDTKTSHLLAPKACPRYLTRIIKGVDNSVQTPDWIAEKLLYSGQNLHSLVVDVTNFVLLELGQPLHAFDLDKISGDISVRYSQAGENIELLNEQKIELADETLVIADEKNVLAIAGIMGGAGSSSSKQTKDILLEAAFFDSVFMAGKARNYGLHTESSLRFERGVDFNKPSQAIDRATQLILEIAGGQASIVNESLDKSHLPILSEICLRQTMLTKILGFELESDWVGQQFKALGFIINKVEQGDFTITPPSFRFDINIERDLIEELARLYGYDKLPSKPLSFNTKVSFDKRLAVSDITQSLLSNGYNEAICYSFISDVWHKKLYPETKAIALSNPISKDLSIMRPSLIAGLLQTIIDNKRYGQENNRFFETGLCFDGIAANEQSQKIAGVIEGNRFDPQWSNPTRTVDFYDIKTDVELLLAKSGKKYHFVNTTLDILHPNKGADIIVEGKNIGYFGALSPIIEADLSINNVYIFELDLEVLRQKRSTKYQPFSNKQTINRDLSIVLDENISYAVIEKSILKLKQGWLIRLKLLDVYIGEHIVDGQRSLLLSLTYQPETTAIDEQIDELVAAVLSQLVKQFNAIQR